MIQPPRLKPRQAAVSSGSAVNYLFDPEHQTDIPTPVHGIRLLDTNTKVASPAQLMSRFG
jgi:hypothetical protein